MKKLKLFFACLLMAVLSIGQVWADPAAAGTTLFSEDFSSYSADDVPSGSVSAATGRVIYGGGSVTYTSTNGTGSKPGTTKIWDENTGGGTAPEILVGKQGTSGTPGSFKIAGIPSGGAQVITVSWTQNKQLLTGILEGTGYSTTYTFPKPTTTTATISFDITVADGADETFDLTLRASSSNVRVDDILITVKTAGEGGSSTPTCATPTFSPAAGSYEGTQDVTISSTADATIYYTTDDSDPTTSVTRKTYSSPIAVSADMTIKAYAVKAEYDDSEVAEAAYTITEGPDAVIDFTSNTEWQFPADYTLDEDDYSDGTYTVTVKGVGSGKGYKYSSGKLLVGQNGAHVILPAFTSPIEKIVCPGVSGASTSVKWNVYDGETAVSTQVTGCTSDVTFEIDPQEANKQYTIKVESAHNLQISHVKIYFGAAPAVAKPTISGDVNFVTSTTVTLACSTTGAEIYYTTDGSDPKTSGSKGTSFSLTETKTVRAIAKLGSDWSAEATPKTFTKVTPMTTAAELRSFATSSAQNAFIQLDGWKVTFVKGNNAYMIDPSNEGVILNNASHGYVAGDELNDEVVEASVKLASGRVQLSGFTSTDITATSGTVSPVEVTDFSTILAANQSRLITLKNATYASSTGTFSDGEHLIYFYDQFSANPTLVDGTTYDVTGIVIYYNNGTTEKVQIAPRTSDDVEAQSPVVIPTAASLAALKAAARGTYIVTLTNAVVSYVNGKNVFIEEGATGALIYLDTHSYEAGNCLNGDYQVTTEDFQGKFEISAIEPQAGAATTTAEIPLTTVSIATLNADFASYESRRIKIAGANVTDAISGSDRNGAINDGAALAVYASVTNTITLTENDNVDIIGYPGFHYTDQQLTVWAQADITVNVKEDPELAYNPAVVNVLLSDLASFTPAELEYATGFDGLAAITYESSDPSIATVETDGTVTLVATAEGSTTITASFAGNATYKADNASYTINVSATPITPVYTMSFDMTRASYDAAADAQVVWNSSVVTMTADKNEGTKVTNYLAGNYSGTTLIAETRFYTNNSLSFVPQSGVTITKIEWMSTAKGYATKLAAETFVNATAVVDGTDDKLVIITPSAAGEISVTLTHAARATGITVYYTAESEKAKLPASISIDDMNMAVGDDDILLSAIAATSNPNKKAISYAVTSGTAVTIEGTGAEAALHAAAEGSATITATIPDDLGNYTGATTSFMITVAAAATLESIAISGEATELVYTEGQSFNPAGLTVMGHYSNGSDAEITEGIVWAFDPDPLTKGTTSVSVTATVGTVTSSDAVVVDGLTVSGPAPVGDNYVKVTASQTDWSGDYILVYEDGTDAYVWNGDYSDGASNYASATISSNTIAKPAAAAVITIAAASEGKYTLQVNGDKYFQDNGSNAKLIFTDAIADAAEVTISYETDWTKLLFSERCIRFNNTSGQTRFRFYAANNQQAVQLYKKEAPKYSVTYAAGEGSGDAPAAVEYEEGETFTVAAADLFTAPAGKEFDKWNDGTNDYAPGATYTVGTADVVLTAYWKDAAPTPTADYTREVTPGNYGTICLPKAGTIEGASIFEIAYYGEASKTIFVDEITSGHMGAGVPYIFQATAAQLKVTYDDKAAVDVAAGEANGLHGFYNLENEEATLPLADDASLGNYILYQNQYWLVSGRPAYINNFRAYIKLSEISPKEPALAPGRRRVAMAVNGENAATGFENIESGDKPMKVMIEGTMYIIRGEKVYDATGRLVK